MLISYKHKFLFIHIYKNAGTSITQALLPFSASYLQYEVSRLIKRIIKRPVFSFDPRPFHSHIRAHEIVEKIGIDTFKSFFSFAIVRNPWDWQVSLYKFTLKTPSHPQHELFKKFGSFDEYIRWRCAEEVRFQKDFICSSNGELLVDYVGRFENLAKDFQTICSKIGIAASLPKLNVSNTIPYQEYYNKETMDLVERAFEPDITYFNYQF